MYSMLGSGHAAHTYGSLCAGSVRRSVLSAHALQFCLVVALVLFPLTLKFLDFHSFCLLELSNVLLQLLLLLLVCGEHFLPVRNFHKSDRQTRLLQHVPELSMRLTPTRQEHTQRSHTPETMHLVHKGSLSLAFIFFPPAILLPEVLLQNRPLTVFSIARLFRAH